MDQPLSPWCLIKIPLWCIGKLAEPSQVELSSYWGSPIRQQTAAAGKSQDWGQNQGLDLRLRPVCCVPFSITSKLQGRTWTFTCLSCHRWEEKQEPRGHRNVWNSKLLYGWTKDHFMTSPPPARQKDLKRLLIGSCVDKLVQNSITNKMMWCISQTQTLYVDVTEGEDTAFIVKRTG